MRRLHHQQGSRIGLRQALPITVHIREAKTENGGFAVIETQLYYWDQLQRISIHLSPVPKHERTFHKQAYSVAPSPAQSLTCTHHKAGALVYTVEINDQHTEVGIC
jgi:hypothetical protein